MNFLQCKIIAISRFSLKNQYLHQHNTTAGQFNTSVFTVLYLGVLSAVDERNT